MSSFHINVGVRFRPHNERESGEGHSCLLDIEHASVTLNSKAYQYNSVFDESANTATVYKGLCESIVSGCVGGFSGCFFAYGQTGSGKTHTLLGSSREPGITILSAKELFEAMQQTENEYLVRCSYVQIYNENVQDLCGDGSGSLPVRDDPATGPFVQGAREIPCTCVEEVLEVISMGERNRSYGTTKMNHRSSRSHTILKLYLESKPAESEEPGTAAPTRSAIQSSVLNLVDLAGSERLAKTGASGARAREGANINTSLLQLGIVINELAKSCENGSASSASHVPFRSSKLTRLLSTALGGNSRTAVICCASGAASNAAETKSTLEFAKRCAVIVNVVSRTYVDEKDAMLSNFKDQIKDLKAQLAAAADKATEARLSNSGEGDVTPSHVNRFRLLGAVAERKVQELETEKAVLGAKIEELEGRLIRRKRRSRLRRNRSSASSGAGNGVSQGNLQEVLHRELARHRWHTASLAVLFSRTTETPHVEEASSASQTQTGDGGWSVALNAAAKAKASAAAKAQPVSDGEPVACAAASSSSLTLGGRRHSTLTMDLSRRAALSLGRIERMTREQSAADEDARRLGELAALDEIAEQVSASDDFESDDDDSSSSDDEDGGFGRIRRTTSAEYTKRLEQAHVELQAQHKALILRFTQAQLHARDIEVELRARAAKAERSASEATVNAARLEANLSEFELQLTERLAKKFRNIATAAAKGSRAGGERDGVAAAAASEALLPEKVSSRFQAAVRSAAKRSLREDHARRVRDLEDALAAARIEEEALRSEAEASRQKHDEIFRQHIRARLDNDELRAACARWERLAAKATEDHVAAGVAEDDAPSFRALKQILNEAQHQRIRRSVELTEVRGF